MHPLLTTALTATCLVGIPPAAPAAAANTVHPDPESWEVVVAGYVVQLAHVLGPESWPGDTVRVGVLGAPQVAAALRVLVPDGLDGRPVAVTEHADSQTLDPDALPEILYVGRDALVGHARLAAAGHEREMVTVSDAPGFLDLGGDVAIERRAVPILRVRTGSVSRGLAAFLATRTADGRYAQADQAPRRAAPR
jgi:hypothetical protein